MTQQKILMCAPDFFGVNYIINPWMQEGLGKTEAVFARSQWMNLKRGLEHLVKLEFVKPQEGLPDMVFTANAGFVIGETAVVSRFHSKERQGEEPFFKTWFESNGFKIAAWPQDVHFEGAGDALLDRGQNFIWMAHGFRSDAAASALVEKIYNRRAVPVKLVDPRFYHLDTCLCPLAGGFVMYFPKAFDDVAQKTILDLVPENKRIVVDEGDALKFSCNAVDVGGHIFMNDASTELQDRLRREGFTPVISPLGEFMKSGGAAKCLTLKLVEN